MIGTDTLLLLLPLPRSLLEELEVGEDWVGFCGEEVCGECGEEEEDSVYSLSPSRSYTP